MQWFSFSTLGLLQPQPPVQSPLLVQVIAQLPLLKQTWPVGHVAQVTGCPQLLSRVPQRPAQVAPRDSGVQQIPP
jgi:hypothetical protein